MPSELSIAWRWRKGVTLAAAPDGVARLTIDGGDPVDFRPASPRVGAALLRLADGADETSLVSELGDDGEAITQLFYYLFRLRRRGLLVADVRCAGGLLATLVPCARDLDVSLPVAATETAWTLSRFAYLRRDGGDLVLECPEAPCAVQVKSADVVCWLHEACAPVRCDPDTPRAKFCALLARLGFLVDADAQESEPRQTWEFHDQLFHYWARQHDPFRPHGGTYRFRDRFPPPPAIRPPYAGEALALSTALPRASGSLLEVMESRRSQRAMGARPVTRDQVAEILYRVARVKETLDSSLYQGLRRPFPSGGAIHELEFYLAVGACDGLESGLYHYRGRDHALTRLERGAAAARDMIDDCAAAWGQPGSPPQCLVVLASRLPRLAWKYEGIAYKISLMNAGVVIQSLYLVCTDLGLNGSAAGSGRPELFAAATGASSWEETSIAEFGFGSRPD
jgi:SagB-type dehydrogenase family enzyme